MALLSADGTLGADAWPSAARGASTDARPADVAPPKNVRRARLDELSRSVIIALLSQSMFAKLPCVARCCASRGITSIRLRRRHIRLPLASPRTHEAKPLGPHPAASAANARFCGHGTRCYRK